MKKYIVFIIVAFYFFSGFSQSQNNNIFKAMQDELERNFNQLSLPELQKPFYIAYTIANAELTYFSARLGSISNENFHHNRTQRVDLLVGSNQRANNNYADMNSIYQNRATYDVPIEDNYIATRRSLWKATDSEYKNAAEIYASKISAINNQNIPQSELNLADFYSSEKVELYINDEKVNVSLDELKSIAIDVSSVFKNYPEITNSYISAYYYKTRIYLHNSEGSNISYPINLTAIRVTAEAMSKDGESLFDHNHYYAKYPHQLPQKDILIKDTESLCENLVNLSNADVFNDYYSGPVMIENQAFGEFIIQQVFDDNNSLIASRKMIVQNEQISNMFGDRVKANRLELRHNRRIMDRGISIYSKPNMKTINNINLIGSYEVDAQAVIPENTSLVEDGILRNFLYNRTPTKTNSKSNGASRLAINHRAINFKTSPGVIHFIYNNPKTKEELKQELIHIAKDLDLDYAIIIRKFEYDVHEKYLKSSGWFGNSEKLMSRPLEIYKVNLETGEEQIIRGAEVAGLNIRSLNRILGTSNNDFVYNAMKSIYSSYYSPGYLMGIPVSIICPDAILFEEVEIRKDDKSMATNLPLLTNPIEIIKNKNK